MSEWNPDRNLVVQLPIRIPRQEIAYLICNALEGGSCYWADRVEIDYWPKGAKYAHEAIASGMTTFTVYHDDEETEVPARIPMALKQMAKEYPRHWEDFINENADADTGDIFFQLLCFGEVVYG